MGKDTKLKKLARTLLTTTCLTAAAGSAGAATFLESSYPGGDFSNVVGSPSVLDAAYTQVQGTVGSTDLQDFFKIPGLVAGGSYNLNFTETDGSAQLTLYDGTAPISGPFSGAFSGNILVPADQNLVFGIHSGESPSSTYVVNFSQPTPEPGTMGLAGLALAGALTLRRRKKN